MTEFLQIDTHEIYMAWVNEVETLEPVGVPVTTAVER